MPTRRSCGEKFLLCLAATGLTFFVVGLLCLLCCEHTDNLDLIADRVSVLIEGQLAHLRAIIRGKFTPPAACHRRTGASLNSWICAP